ncbi:isopenicillin N synthase family dioxygenase [Streptomyces specialis]|uniref:isopenicillin N synthase family dioxygenase n=1 Tax=Streptomyces specialis TaxID=498367 RepID=UPI00073EE4A6|nr:2-oxoglutarate and iron-dependent oxygenase domain-containing protein [Streptomyces specialis]
MTEFHVPTIDIGPYLVSGATARTSQDCAEVARRIDLACREVGFMQVTGHQVADSAIEGLAAALDEFFALPLERKTAYRRDAGDNRGYAPPKSESLSMSLGVPPAGMMNDFYEAFTVGAEAGWYPGRELPRSSYAPNTWPDAAPGFRPAVEEYFSEVTYFSRVLLTAMADALGLDPGYFDTMTDYSIDALKMNHYALPEGEIELAGELMGMGAHTDFGILTVLWADQVPGLQVLGSDQRWHDVQPADGALLINLGDAMARWTNDRWMSTLHRVNPPIVNGRVLRRRSAAFFFDGNHDAVIEALPGCFEPGQELYPPITVAENISAKVAGLKTGRAPAGAAREAARVLAAE